MNRMILLLAGALAAHPALAAPEPLASVVVAELQRKAAAGEPAKPLATPVDADVRFERTATVLPDGTVMYGCRDAGRRDFRISGERDGAQVQR